jgi:lipopolysaccharide/colanic/teichoic acid biosynthesis glycosyltransferase
MSSPSHSPVILSEVPRAAPQLHVSTKCTVPLAYRCFEMVVAATALLFCAPILAIIAIIIRTGTPGPFLFVQDRLGLSGKPFRFVKFRTLYADAKQRFPGLYAYKYSQEELLDLKFKVSSDPRVTPQGAWLRQSSFDELPNFWNVLTGEMALVGPRPEIPEMLPYYTSEMRRKFSVRPGITGLAQISGRGRLGFYQTVAYDLQYVDQRSISSDLKIIFKTIRMVFLRDGAF